MRSAVDVDGQTTVMVTHDARAAATADRVLFLADGRVVADITDPTEDLILDTLGQTTVMVTHDAHAAAIADRVLFLADGDIVRDLGPSSAHEILATLEAVSGR